MIDGVSRPDILKLITKVGGTASLDGISTSLSSSFRIFKDQVVINIEGIVLSDDN